MKCSLASQLDSLGRRSLVQILSDRQTQRIWELCTQRITRKPVQYVIEEWDFRDLTLKMRPPVFIPRPETEELVRLVLDDLQKQGVGDGLRFLEVGCGSGAISLSLLHSMPQLRGVALDQSQEAVDLTKENAHRLGLSDRLEVLHLDLIKDEDLVLRRCAPVQLLVSNPPYLFTEDMNALAPEVYRFEDHAALDGGQEGMCVIDQILTLASELLSEQGHVYLEVEPRHPPIIRNRLQQRIMGLEYVVTHYDISNRPRFCVLQRR
ncbi:MTRF1L release factor glutamine methyltransferase isoform X2 [Denticeps clupeoides]|uniref:MTRF1L release factor glutamine methyltransferase isoform X2 n=1 Tax=Denticeps clupeoides TaxID=299321 RepID=UPI0010A51A2E|nr:MTRF1L release factor glutamine methyltransferase isoform X2 [Denticeps clupeoides]